MQVLPIPSPRLQPVRRTSYDFAAILLVLTVLVVIGIVASWQLWHANRVYTGVTIAGVAVGGMTRSEAYQRTVDELASYTLPPVTITYQGKQWLLPSTSLHVEPDLSRAVNDAYLVGRQGSTLDNLAEQLQSLWYGHVIAPPLAVDPAPVRAALDEIAAHVAQRGTPARKIGSTTVPAQPGIAVDVATTLRAALAALQRPDGQAIIAVPLAANPTDPPHANPWNSTATPVLNQPLILRSERYNLNLALDPVLLDRIAISREPLQVNTDDLLAFLTDAAANIDTPAQDARLHFDPVSREVTVLQTSRPGRKLDIAATVQSVYAALASGSDTATLAVHEAAPAVDSSRISEMGIRELVASSSTYFAGSSASRIHNIEVGAEKLEGVVIPPDGIFSFNEIVRDVSSANGFEDSLIIWGDRTAVGVGGGVCQVSTTVFRTAYEGGFPIVERYNHGYVVDWYGEPGLDATIYTPTVDFKFRNDTGAFLLIDPVVDKLNGVITFNFYGTQPARTVTVSEPQITQVVEPEPATYVVDESLAAGEQKQAEWQKEGMTVTVTRTIVENDVAQVDTLVSHYQAWRAVYLVGPGTDIAALAASAP